MNNNIIHFLNIYVLLYSSLRLMDIDYEDFSIIFKEEILNINKVYKKNIEITIINNIFYIKWIKKDIEIEFLTNILNKNNYTVDNILKEINNSTFSVRGDLIYFFNLVKETGNEQGNDYGKEVKYYKDKSFLVYNVLNSILKTFRGDKNLLEASKYITSLINKYKFSIFYLFRVRNMFLYFYQTVIGRQRFYYFLKNDRNKILESGYIKLIFSDLYKCKKINKTNIIIDLFEGMILLHLLDNKGVNLLNNIRGKKSKILEENIDLFISNFYLDKGLYKKAENILLKGRVKKGFKYYRKLFPIYILSNKKNELINIIDKLIKKGEYSLYFYLKGEDLEKTNIIKFNDFFKKNDNLNIPLNIDINIFKEIIKKDKGINVINKLFKYIKRDHRDYFLKDNDISIILKKL